MWVWCSCWFPWEILLVSVGDLVGCRFRWQWIGLGDLCGAGDDGWDWFVLVPPTDFDTGSVVSTNHPNPARSVPIPRHPSPRIVMTKKGRQISPIGGWAMTLLCESIVERKNVGTCCSIFGANSGKYNMKTKHKKLLYLTKVKNDTFPHFPSQLSTIHVPCSCFD